MAGALDPGARGLWKKETLQDMTALPQQHVSGVFVCWILMAPLVATRDETTGADGSWRFGVTAGEAKKHTHTHTQRFNSRVASLPFPPVSYVDFHN